MHLNLKVVFAHINQLKFNWRETCRRRINKQFILIFNLFVLVKIRPSNLCSVKLFPINLNNKIFSFPFITTSNNAQHEHNYSTFWVLLLMHFCVGSFCVVFIKNCLTKRNSWDSWWDSKPRPLDYDQAKPNLLDAWWWYNST